MYTALTIPVDCINNLQSDTVIVVNPIPREICQFVITDKHWLIENVLCLLSNATKYSTCKSMYANLILCYLAHMLLLLTPPPPPPVKKEENKKHEHLKSTEWVQDCFFQDFFPEVHLIISISSFPFSPVIPTQAVKWISGLNLITKPMNS